MTMTASGSDSSRYSHSEHWLVFGHYGGHNTGDDAMLAGLVLGASPALRRRLLIASKAGSLPTCLNNTGVKTIPASLLSVVWALWHSQGIVLGGGSHFQDDYAGLRYVRHFRYMARFVVLSLLARMLGKRVLWLSMGFGPLFRAPTRWLTRLGLHACHYVTVREQTSARTIQPWISTERTALAFDLAALMVPAQHAAASIPVRHRTAEHILGVSVMSVSPLRTGGAAAERIFWHHLETALADILATHSNVRVRIFIIRGGQREDDFARSAQLYRTLIDVDPARVDIIPYCADPLRTLRKMQDCSTFVATRFHAGVLAYLAGCRLVFLAYHRKLVDLAQEIGLPTQACVRIRADVAPATLRMRIDELVTGAPGYTPTLPVVEAVHRARLHTEILEHYSL
jgi:polysaccharide pyruvyl transferase WcaK-like protein